MKSAKQALTRSSAWGRLSGRITRWSWLNVALLLIASIASATTAWLSWKATKQQAEAAQRTLEIAQYQGYLSYLDSLPRLVIDTASANSVKSNGKFCFQVRNIGRYRSIGYDIYLLGQNGMAKATIGNTQPLIGDYAHSYCLDDKAFSSLHFLVVSHLAFAVQDGYGIYGGDRRSRPGEQYECGFFGFSRGHQPFARDFLPVEVPRDEQVLAWNRAYPSVTGKNVTCKNQYDR